MAGYYNNPQATANAIDPDGWLHTGDLARRRDDGNYRIVGRSRELIIRGGENIYPAEVEEFLHRHPADRRGRGGRPARRQVRRSRRRLGRAQVRRRCAARRLKQYCQGQIAHFKVPQYVMIVESLPRTVTGKIRKHVLRDQAIDDLGSATRLKSRRRELAIKFLCVEFNDPDGPAPGLQ